MSGNKEDSRELSELQKQFVYHYCKSFNALRAAIAAGYSEKGAGQQGCELLKNPKVKEAIDEVLQERRRRMGVTAERVLKELSIIAFADHADYAEVTETDVRFKDTKELKKGASRAISEISMFWNKSGDPNIKVKLHDKVKALELLSKHLGLLVERHEHSGPGGKPIQTVVTDEHTQRYFQDAETIALTRALSKKTRKPPQDE